MRQTYSSEIPRPVEAIVAVRMADGSIVCFQGPIDFTEFKVQWGFEDPLGAPGMTRERAHTTIDWLPGVHREFINGAENFGWRENAPDEPREIPEERKTLAAPDQPKQLEA